MNLLATGWTLAAPQVLWGLLPLLGWLLWQWRLGLQTPAQWNWHPLAEALPVAALGGHRRLRLGLQTAALALLLLALARPQQTGAWVQPPPQGRDLALLLDLSNSMSLTDYSLEGHALTRLQLMQRLLDRFIRSRNGDRIAVLVFGSRAALLCPPTEDIDHVRRQLARLQPGLLGDDTATPDALGLALDAVHHGSLPPALVLIGDGDSGNSGALTAEESLALAVAARIPLHTLMLGDGAASATPDPNAPPQPSYADLARVSGGLSLHARSSAQAIDFLNQVSARETPIQPPPVRRMREVFWAPLALAMLLLALAGRMDRPE